MRCPACQHGNDEGDRFCAECGASLATTCSACSADLKPAAKFCTACGTPTTSGPEPPAVPPGPTLVAQRKTITVVFGDVGGSTGLGERLDPEAAREVMNRYHLDVLEVIGEFGGTVDKFNGDGFMATFGIPEVAEDDASRAVQAAAEIQERFGPFADAVHDRHGGDPITLRIGVNTGEIVIAEGDPDIIGDALNVAARLERACPSGGVLVGPETWRLTRGRWSYEPQGEVTVAGRVEPVEVFLVRAATSAADSEAATATPFVGRDDELSIVGSQRDRAVETSSLRLVNVIGSPGLGKSRLAREVSADLDFDHRHAIACERAGATTFAPVVDLVRSVAAVGPTEPPAGIMAALRRRFADTDFADGEAERLHDATAGLVGAGPVRSTEESFWAIRRLVETLGREGPTLIVVDDIQWAEPFVLDLVEHLAEWVTDSAVVLLCLARPEIRDLRPSLTEAGRRADAVIALEGLDAQATAALAQRMLGEGELPAALIERIPASTEGNPLFVRELVRMLVDDGVVVRGDSGWELTIDAEAVEVPPTIASLLAARIDRLDDTERAVLERAAVIGPEFTEGALRAIVGDVPGGLSVVLERLRRMELVEPTGSYWGDHALHRFHHVLIRDAAYRRLLKGARADLHEQVATWLEHESEGLSGDHAEVIAFHEEQTFGYRSELGPLDEHSVDLGRRASGRLAAAAASALARDDLTAAGPLALRALDCLPADDEGRGELLLTACEALLGTGDVVRGEAAVDELDALATDDRLRAWAACFRAQLTSMTEPDRLPEAEQEATSAAGILEALRDDAGAAKGHLTRARILALLGRVGEAETELDLALTAAREADDARRITAVLGNAPLAALWGPSPVPRAGGRCLDIVRLLRITTRAPAVEATSMRCQALLEALRGRFDTAHKMIDRCRRKVDELGLRLGSLETELFAGQIELLAGDHDAAEVALRTASTGLTAMRLGAEAGQATALLARVLVTKGEVGEAEVLVDTAEQMAGRNLKSAVAWRLARAELLLAQGEADAAVEVAQAAVDVVADTDLVVDQTDAELVLANALRATGDEAGAADAEARASRLVEAKGATAMMGGGATDVAAPRAQPTPDAAKETAFVDLERRPTAPDPPSAPAVEPWDPEQTSVMRVLRKTIAANAAGDPAGVVAMMADGFEWQDHRPAVGGAYDGETFAESMALATELSVRVVLCSTDRVALAHYRGTGGPFELDFLAVVVSDIVGLALWCDTFDLDQLDEAIDCYFAAIEQDAATHGDELLLNTSSRTSDRMTAHLSIGDPEGAGAQVTDDARRIEHRQYAAGVGDIVGREAIVAMFRTVGDVEWVGRTIAERGDRLALRVWRVTSQDFPVHYLSLVESGSDGRQVLSEGWDLTDADQAFQALERRAAALDAPPVEPWDQQATTVAKTKAAVRDAMNAGDHELHATMYSDGFVWFDHRPMVDGTFEVDALLDTLRPIQRIEARPVLGGVDRVEVVAITITAQDFTHEFLNVHWCSPDGPYVSIDTFDLSDLAAAVDRYHELVVEDAERFGGAVVANAASRLEDRCEAHVSAGRVDALEECYAPDIAQHEAEVVLRGRDHVVESAREVAASGGSMSARTVRVAGDRLALRIQNFTADGFIIDFCALAELDDEGRIRYGRRWDLADWDEAVAEFERRAAALERPALVEPWDPSSTPIVRTIDAGLEDIIAHDYERHRQRYADDFVYTDHRPGLLGTFDADQQVDSFRGADHVVSRPLLVPSERIGLFRFAAETQGFSIVFLSVAHLGEDGLMRSFDSFEPEQLDEAIARCHETAERFGRDVVANDASRLLDRLAAHLSLGRVDGIEAHYTPDVVQHERSSAVGELELRGRDAVMENFRVVASSGGSMTARTVRVGGDRLALRIEHYMADDFRVDAVGLAELDHEGRIRYAGGWDLADWDEAVAEFERRAAALDAPSVEPWDVEATTVMRTLRRSEALVADGLVASAEFAALIADELQWVDHRPMFAGEHTVEQFLHGFSLVEKLQITPLVCGTDRVAVDLHSYENREFVIEMVTVCAVTPDGQLWVHENYDPDQLDDAVDRYHELVREDAERFGDGAFTNPASRIFDRVTAHLSLGDLDGVRQFFTDDIEQHDSRPGFGGHRIVGWDNARATLVDIFDGGATLSGHLLRAEGERLALRQEHWVGRGFEVDYLSVLEVDHDGRLRFQALYGLDQYDEAVAEFERRVAALEQPAVEPWDPEATTVMRMLRRSEELVAADRHRSDEFAALVADDLHYVDHRSLLAGEYTRAQFFDNFAMIENHLRITPLLCGTDRVSVDLHLFEVGGFHIEILTVCAVTPDGRMWITENYEPADLDAAVGRYHELVREDAARFGGEVIENAASRNAERLQVNLNVGDLDGWMKLVADDIVDDDRRPTARHSVSGREQVAASYTSGNGTFFSRPLRVAGETLEMSVACYVQDGFALDLLRVAQADDEGRAQWVGLFELAQHHEAVAEFERRAAALERPPVEPWDPDATTAMRTFRVWEEQTNRGEHHRNPILYPEGMTWVDHRPMFAGTFGADELYRSLHPVQAGRLRPILVTADRVALAHITMDVKDFDAEILELKHVDPDGVAVVEHTFDLDQLDEAVDVYHQLVVEDAERFGGEVVANWTSRQLDLDWARVSMGDVDRALASVTPDFVQVDHRSGFGGHRIDGRQELEPNLRAMFDGKATMSGPTIRVAGERLALQVVQWRGHDYDVDMLILVESDAHGLDRSHDLYDLDQYDEAMAEFDRRLAAIEAEAGVPVAPWDPEATTSARSVRAAAQAVVAGDADAHRAVYAEDFVYTDHRPMFAGVYDREQQVTSFRGVTRFEYRPVLVATDRVGLYAYAIEVQGFATEFISVGAGTPDDEVRSLDCYEVDQLDEAIDRYFEVVQEDAERYGGEAIENTASRVAHRINAHLVMDDVAGCLQFWADDVRHVEKRRDAMGLADARGKDAVVRNAEMIAPFLIGRTIRVVGESLALMVVRAPSPGFPVHMLALVESAPDGRYRFGIAYDLEDWDEAVAEFERRAAEPAAIREGSESGVSTFERVARRNAELVMAKDVAGQRALCADDMVYVDHRPLFAGTFGPDDFVRSTSPVEHLSFRIARRDDELTGVVHSTCVTQDFDVEILNVVVVRPDGRFVSIDTFDIDDHDTAMARYDEIVAERSNLGRRVAD